MAARVTWLPHAEAQLYEASEYGREQFGSKAARKLVKGIRAQSKLLAAHPYLGGLEPYVKHLPGSYRSLVVHNHYKLIYRVDEAKDKVIIFALWDTRRDPGQLVNALKTAELL